MRLTISTGKYMDELFEWIKHNDYNHFIENFETVEDSCFVTLNGTVRVCETIVCLFETIMLEQNQIAKTHERLRDVLSNIVFTPVKKEISRIVRKYIAEHDHINLEGFVTFRLNEYAHKVDLVLYAAIKNSLMYT